MPEHAPGQRVVEFHHGMEDKLAYACRLLRKAYRGGKQVVVTGEPATLQRLDALLWVFDAGEFLPHVCTLAGQTWAPRLAATPLWLTDEPAQAPGERDVLVNVGDEIPPSVERFERFFEVVSNEADDRQRGRQRWRQYEARGWQVQAHAAKDMAA